MGSAFKLWVLAITTLCCWISSVCKHFNLVYIQVLNGHCYSLRTFLITLCTRFSTYSHIWNSKPKLTGQMHLSESCSWLNIGLTVFASYVFDFDVHIRARVSAFFLWALLDKATISPVVLGRGIVSTLGHRWVARALEKEPMLVGRGGRCIIYGQRCVTLCFEGWMRVRAERSRLGTSLSDTIAFFLGVVQTLSKAITPKTEQMILRSFKCRFGLMQQCKKL